MLRAKWRWCSLKKFAGSWTSKFVFWRVNYLIFAFYEAARQLRNFFAFPAFQERLAFWEGSVFPIMYCVFWGDFAICCKYFVVLSLFPQFFCVVLSLFPQNFLCIYRFPAKYFNSLFKIKNNFCIFLLSSLSNLPLQFFLRFPPYSSRNFSCVSPLQITRFLWRSA